MNKPSLIIACPLLTRSGYGEHSISICRALIESDKYDVGIIPIPWGNTPQTALNRNNPEDKMFFDRIRSGQINANDKPDIFIHVTIPSEFQPAGRFNIGVTAGIECTKTKPEWIEGLNRMDLNIMTSKFTAEVFAHNVFDKIDKKTNQKIGELRSEKPMEVLFEGYDPNIFGKNKPIAQGIKDVMKDLPKFNFLFVGHWLDGTLGHDRKDVGMLVKIFMETFRRKATKNMPGLILKTGMAGFSKVETEVIRDKIEQIEDLIRMEGWKKALPPIYLLNGDLTNDEMNSLYNHPKVKAMVSLSHGEGFGRPLLEFTTTGKPVIASGWSGQMDFLHPEYSIHLPGRLIEVDRSARNEWITDGKWFQCDYNIVAQVLLNCHSNYDFFEEKSRKHVKYSKDNFTQEKMAEKLIDILEKNVQLTEQPKKLKLKMPKLTKVT